MEDQRKLQDDVAQKYDVVKVKPGKHYFSGYGYIDLTAIDVSQADALVERGFKWLQAKTPGGAKPSNKVSIPPVAG